MREPIRLAPADPVAPAVRRLGERPTAARMVRRRLFTEGRLDPAERFRPVRRIRRAS
jgi:hypothetical protein